MRIALFAPYGPFSQESGLMYLIASYASKIYPDIVQLKCNGVFSVCDRDSETNWRRDFSSCFQCSADQQHLQKWSGLSQVELSTLITPQAVEHVRRWLNEIPAENLVNVTHQKLKLYDICTESLQKRITGSGFDPANKRHEQILRGLYTSILRLYSATQNYIEKYAPNYILLAGGSDALTATSKLCALQMGVEPVVFRWDVHKHSVSIKRERTGKTMQSELLLDGVANMRPDHNTWPNELVSIISEVMEFLELEQAQLTLPISTSTPNVRLAS